MYGILNKILKDFIKNIKRILIIYHVNHEKYFKYDTHKI